VPTPAAPASATKTRVVVTDANVVINFIHAGMLDELPAMVDMDFVVTDEVYAEITRPEQRHVLDAALAAGTWTRESLVEPEAVALYATLAVTMGRGEAASLALAVTGRCFLASDERRVFLREARERLGQGRIINTPGLLVMAIRRGSLTVADADRIKAVLETRNFTMKFRSFADVIV
jgi:predicted nucleic acid-binding protein